MKKQVILEIIPSKIKDGDIIQISALKLHDLVLIERFNVRLDENKINNTDLLNIINYNKDQFVYLESTKKIKSKFKKFIGDYNLLYLSNSYTLNYLEDYNNKKIDILEFLELEYSDNIINEIINIYKLENSNHVVDLLYEAYIYKSNFK